MTFRPHMTADEVDLLGEAMQRKVLSNQSMGLDKIIRLVVADAVAVAEGTRSIDAIVQEIDAEWEARNQTMETHEMDDRL